MIPLINSWMPDGTHFIMTGAGGVGHYRECIHMMDELACCFLCRHRIARESEISRSFLAMFLINFITFLTMSISDGYKTE